MSQVNNERLKYFGLVVLNAFLFSLFFCPRQKRSFVRYLRGFQPSLQCPGFWGEFQLRLTRGLLVGTQTNTNNIFGGIFISYKTNWHFTFLWTVLHTKRA